MFLRPFGLYCSACFGSRLCPSSVHIAATYSGTVLFPLLRRLWPRDPRAMQLKLQQTGEGARECPAS